MKNSRPHDCTQEQFRDFAFWHIQNAFEQMPKHVGTYIYTYDFDGFKSKQANVGMIKKIIPEMSINFPEICPLVCVINHSTFI